MMTAPTGEHEWLKQFVGEWTFEGRCTGPDGQPMTSTGRESVKMFGGLWVVGNGQGEMPGGAGTMHSVITLGYDPTLGKYVGSWVSDVMATMFVYRGSLDASRKVLTLDCEGPSFEDPRKIVPYQDIVEFHGDGTRHLRSQTPGPDGAWVQFMHATYRRIG